MSYPENFDLPLCGFKVHTPNLLKEIADSALIPGAGNLYIPLNILMRYLGLIAARCSEINDPVLNRLMIELTLYESADPESDNYDPLMLDKAIINHYEYMKLKE